GEDRLVVELARAGHARGERGDVELALAAGQQHAAVREPGGGVLRPAVAGAGHRRPGPGAGVVELGRVVVGIARGEAEGLAADRACLRKTASAPEAALVAAAAPPVGSYRSLVAIEFEPPARRILPAFGPWTRTVAVW